MPIKKASQVIIRPARNEDFEKLGGIFLRAVKDSRASQLRDTDSQTVSKMTRYFNNLTNRQMSDQNINILVAEKETGPVGFVCTKGTREESCSEIESLFVDPAYQGAGTGKSLISAALEKLQNTASRKVILWADMEDTAIDRFYTGIGWMRCRDIVQDNPQARIKHLIQYQRNLGID